MRKLIDVQKGNGMKLLYLLSILVSGWMPAASGEAQPGADLSAYVYLHVTRSEAPLPAQSCPGRVRLIRS